MASAEDVSAQREAARQQSKAVWDAMAAGWHARREEIWQNSHPVSEWMIRKLDPQPGDTVLELAAGLADTGRRGPPAGARSGREERGISDVGCRADGSRNGQRGWRLMPLGLHANDRSRCRFRGDSPCVADRR